MNEERTEASSARSNGAEREDWLRLAFVGLPARRCLSALERWKTPSALLQAARSGREDALLSTKGITPVTVERLENAATRDLARALAAMEEFSIRLLLLEDAEYPVALRSIPDPPPYLFVRGKLEPRDEVAVAIVGTRVATDYGHSLARQFSYQLAQRGVSVVSGLARGVDTTAHRGALEAGGRTLAVCGCGLDIAYPSENKELMEQIVANGAVFSEFAPTVHPEAWHFPARNRIISGLSVGTVVVEAAERSGALITADFALEQGREVFAVPGNIHRAQSKGCHGLIKQGAVLTESVEDIIDAINSRSLPFEVSGESGQKDEKQQSLMLEESTSLGDKGRIREDLTPDENRVYLALDVEPRHIDEIALSIEMSAAEINAVLVLLEIKGAARRLPGNLFARLD